MAAAILIVDDDEMLGRILTRVLQGDGYEVIHTPDADRAVRLAQQHHPRLALVDLCMPGRDGVEVARLLRKEVADVTIILMTAFPFRLREHPELGENIARLLIKPLDLAVLREAIQAALPRTVNGTGLMKC